MKIKATLSIGFANADREDIIEIPDDELEGLDEHKREELINTYLQE